MSSSVESLMEAEDNVPDGDLTPQPDTSPDLPPDRFSNRELSWLAFNERVLVLAEDSRSPRVNRASTSTRCSGTSATVCASCWIRVTSSETSSW